MSGDHLERVLIMTTGRHGRGRDPEDVVRTIFDVAKLVE